MKNVVVIGLVLLLLVSCAHVKEPEKAEEPEIVEEVKEEVEEPEEVEEVEKVWCDKIEDEWYVMSGDSSHSTPASIDSSGNCHFELTTGEYVIKRNEPFEYNGELLDCTWLDAPNDGMLVILHGEDGPHALYFAKEADSFKMYDAGMSTYTVLFNNGRLLSNQPGESQDVSYQCTDSSLYIVADKQYTNLPIREYNDNIIIFTIDMEKTADENDMNVSDFFGGFIRKSAVK